MREQLLTGMKLLSRPLDLVLAVLSMFGGNMLMLPQRASGLLFRSGTKFEWIEFVKSNVVCCTRRKSLPTVELLIVKFAEECFLRC